MRAPAEDDKAADDAAAGGDCTRVGSGRRATAERGATGGGEDGASSPSLPASATSTWKRGGKALPFSQSDLFFQVAKSFLFALAGRGRITPSDVTRKLRMASRCSSVNCGAPS